MLICLKKTPSNAIKFLSYACIIKPFTKKGIFIFFIAVFKSGALANKAVIQFFCVFFCFVCAKIALACVKEKHIALTHFAVKNSGDNGINFTVFFNG